MLLKAAFFDKNDEYKVNRYLTLTAFNGGWEIWFKNNRIMWGETKSKGQARKNLRRNLSALKRSLWSINV